MASSVHAYFGAVVDPGSLLVNAAAHGDETVWSIIGFVRGGLMRWVQQVGVHTL